MLTEGHVGIGRGQHEKAEARHHQGYSSPSFQVATHAVKTEDLDGCYTSLCLNGADCGYFHHSGGLLLSTMLKGLLYLLKKGKLEFLVLYMQIKMQQQSVLLAI